MAGCAGDRHRGARLATNVVRPLAVSDLPRLRELLRDTWGSTRMATRGRLYEVTELPGFVAEGDGRWLGHAAYRVDEAGLEVMVLHAVVPGMGAGPALLASCAGAARVAGATRFWLISTNDNTEALRFYQRLGFRLVALHRDAVDDARRRLKPEIPPVSADGIAIRDELELELPPADWATFVETHAWPS